MSLKHVLYVHVEGHGRDNHLQIEIAETHKLHNTIRVVDQQVGRYIAILPQQAICHMATLFKQVKARKKKTAIVGFLSCRYLLRQKFKWVLIGRKFLVRQKALESFRRAAQTHLNFGLCPEMLKNNKNVSQVVRYLLTLRMTFKFEKGDITRADSLTSFPFLLRANLSRFQLCFFLFLFFA